MRKRESENPSLALGICLGLAFGSMVGGVVYLLTGAQVVHIFSGGGLALGITVSLIVDQDQ